MPLYKWNCPKCGNEVEILQWSNTEIQNCIVCGQEMVKKPTAPALIKMGALSG